MIALLGLAFGIGLISAVTPCGIALLPPYLVYAANASATSSLPRRLVRGLRAGLAVSLGFVGALSVVAFVIAVGARVVVSALPWVGLVIGVGIVVLGIVLLAGRSLPLRFSPPANGLGSSHAGRRGSWRDAIAFGAGYALSSLSCSIGLLIAVISQALVVASVPGVLAVFGAYGLGSTVLLVGLSVAAAGAGGLMSPVSRRLGRVGALVPRIAGAVLLVVGAYLVIYWLPSTVGYGYDNPLLLAGSEFSSNVSAWLSQHQATVVLVAVLAIAVAVGAAFLFRRPAARDTTACDSEENAGEERATVDDLQ